jgi:hypothetical protein
MGLLLIRDVVEPGFGCLYFFKLHKGRIGTVERNLPDPYVDRRDLVCCF